MKERYREDYNWDTGQYGAPIGGDGHLPALIPWGYSFQNNVRYKDPDRLAKAYKISQNAQYQQELLDIINMEPHISDATLNRYQSHPGAIVHPTMGYLKRGWYDIEKAEQADSVMAKEQTLEHAYNLYARMEEWKLAWEKIIINDKMQLEGHPNFSKIRWGLYNNIGRSEAYAGKQIQRIRPNNGDSPHDSHTDTSFMNMIYNQRPGSMTCSGCFWGNTLTRKILDMVRWRARHDFNGAASGAELGLTGAQIASRKEDVCRKTFVILFANSENYAQHFRKDPWNKGQMACHDNRLTVLGVEKGQNEPNFDRTVNWGSDSNEARQLYYGFRKNLTDNSCFPTWHEGDSLRHLTKALSKEDWIKVKRGQRNPRTVRTFVVVNPNISPKSFEYFQRAGVGFGSKTIDKGSLTAPYNHTFNEDVYVVSTSVTPDTSIDSQKIEQGEMYQALHEIIFDKILPSTTEIKITWDDDKPEAISYSLSPPAVISSLNSRLAIISKTDAKTWSSELILYFTAEGKPNFKKVANQKTKFDNRKALVSYLDNTGKLNVVWDSAFVNLPFDNSWFGLNTTDITVGGGPAATQSNKEEWQKALIPWITRSKSDNQILSWVNSNGVGQTATDGEYFDREARKAGSRDMSDAVSNPIILAGDLGDTNSAYPGYPEYLITSANDSMIYLFKKDTTTTTAGTNPYSLALNYLPLSMEKKEKDDRIAKYYKATTHTRYGDGVPYVYLQNGGLSVTTLRTPPPAAGTVPTTAPSKHIFLTSTMGQAARGLLALNVAGSNLYKPAEKKGLDDNDWTTSVPLFETPKGTANEMGYTIGFPVNGQLVIDSGVTTTKAQWDNVPVDRSVHMVTFVSSGFNHHKFKAEPLDADDNNESNKEDTALYIYETLGYDIGANNSGNSFGTNYEPGKLIRKISIPKDSVGISGGGLAEPTLVDINNDSIVDIAYAGDRMGNMYRFDLRSADPTKWSVHKVFSQTDRNKPISSAPAVSAINYKHGENRDKFMVLFGSGSDLFRRDIINMDVQQQTFYGIVDDVNVVRTLTPKDLATRTFKEDPKLVIPNATTSTTPTTTTTTTTESTKRATEISSIIANNTDNINLDKNGWKLDLLTYKDALNAFEEKVTTKPQVSIETVAINTKILPKIKFGLARGKGCHSVDFSAQSRVIQLDAQTGGQVTGRSARLSYKNNVESIKYPSGFLFSGLLSFIIIDTKYDGNAFSADGDAGRSGNVFFAKKKTDHGKKDCLGKNSGVGTSRNESGITDDIDVTGPSCDEGIFRRISWREIF